MRRKGPKGVGVLDVGCGTGELFGYLNRTARMLYGVEPSPLGARVAAQRFGAQVFTGTLEQARYPDAFFDVVVLADRPYYMPDPVALLREVSRVLDPDGSFWSFLG